DAGMANRSGIEPVRFTHPLGHQPLLTGLGHEPIVDHAVVVLLRQNGSALPVQRVVGVVDDNVVALMMGSMQGLRSAVPRRCSSTWPATRTASPSATLASSSCAMAG